jgi:hypothetical protein
MCERRSSMPSANLKRANQPSRCTLPEPFRTIRPGDEPSELDFAAVVVLLSIEVGVHSVDALHHETGLPEPKLATALSTLVRGCYVTTARGRYWRPRAAGVLCVPYPNRREATP